MGLGHIMTLANSIIGVSVLAMPFCFKQCGIILSILVLFLSSIMTRLACHFLLKAAVLARRRNYEYLAFHAFGPKGKLMVELCIIGFLFGTCIAFFVVMGDLGPAITSEILGINKSPSIRSSVLVGLALLVVLPLGLLRNVDSLSSLCTATILFYFFLVLKVMSEATTHLLAGDWLQYVHLWRPAGILQCIPIFAMALSCQTQVFEIYETLPDPSLPKMNEVVRAAVNICTGVYVCMGFFGYVAVCRPPQASVIMGDVVLSPAPTLTGNILMSFPSSFTTQIIKLLFVASVACSFPLVIFPCRASLHSLLFRRTPHHESGISGSGGGAATASTTSLLPPGSSGVQAMERIPERRFRLLTILLVAGSLAVAFVLPDIELVLGLVGSSIGTITCLLLPALCFLRVAPSHPYHHSHWGGGKGVTAERLLAQVMIVLGATILILSTYANLHAVDQAHAEEPITPHSLHEGGIILPKVPAAMPPAKLPDPESNVLIPMALPKVIQAEVKKVGLPDASADVVKHSASGGKKDSEGIKMAAADGVQKEVRAEKRQEPPVPVAPDHGMKKKTLGTVEDKSKKVYNEKEEVAKEQMAAVVEAVAKGRSEGDNERAAVAPPEGAKEAPDSVHGDAIKKEEEEVGIEEGAAKRDEEMRREEEEKRKEEEERRKREEKERREKELLQKLADDRKKQQEQINIQMEILKKLEALEGKKSEPEKKVGGESQAVESVGGGGSERKKKKADVEKRIAKTAAAGGKVERTYGGDEGAPIKDAAIVAEESKQKASDVLNLKKSGEAQSKLRDASRNEAFIVKKELSGVPRGEGGDVAISSHRDKPPVIEEKEMVNASVKGISQMKAALPMPLLRVGGPQDGGTMERKEMKAKEREKREVEMELEGQGNAEKDAVGDVFTKRVANECEGGFVESVENSSANNQKVIQSANTNMLSQGELVSSLNNDEIVVKALQRTEESKDSHDAKPGVNSKNSVTMKKDLVAEVKEELNDKVPDNGELESVTNSQFLHNLGLKESESFISPTIKTPLRLSNPIEGKSAADKVESVVNLDGMIMESMPLKRDLKFVKEVSEDSTKKT